MHWNKNKKQHDSTKNFSLDTDNIDIQQTKIDNNKQINRNAVLIVCIELSVLIIVVLLFFGFGKSKSLLTDTIIINEIVCSNDSSLITSKQETPDWIELYNNSDNDINLADYSIISDSRKGEKYTFGDITIPAHEYLVVYATDKTSSQSDAPCLGFNLSKNGETVSFANDSGHEIQNISIPEMYTDVSYALKDDYTWGYCISPTPGAINNTKIQTLDSLLSVSDDIMLKISEVMPNSSDGRDWVEIYNKSDTTVNLALFYISDNSSGGNRYHLPDINLDAGEYYLVNLPNAQDTNDISFGFSEQDCGVYLFNTKNTLIHNLSWTSGLGEDIAVVESDVYTLDTTPGTKNSENIFELQKLTSMDATDPVRINEVLLKNSYSITDEDGDRSAWAEVYNNSSQPISMRNYFLSDDSNSLLKWSFPDTVLEPYEYCIVFLSGKDNTSTQLHTTFKIASDEPAIYLTDISTMRTDTFELPEDRLENVSFGRSEDGKPLFYPYPTPYSENSAGFETLDSALDRRASGVYISEVCASGDDSDWIELFNASDNQVDLSGCYITDSEEILQKYQISSLTISPHEYAVIDANSSFTNDAQLNIDASGETIIITGANGEYIDGFETGMLRQGKTSGRIENDTSFQRVFFSSPTKNVKNSSNIVNGYTITPVFSETDLYFSQEFGLTIKSPSKGASIYYTLDGSTPDNTDTLYTEPLNINNNTVVRAIAYTDGLFPSDVVTSTYLFETPHTVPVVCLAGEADEMKHVFHYSSRYFKPEVPASIEYYEEDGSLGIFFNAGLKPKGRSSLDYDQKSVTIKIRGEYGRDEVIYPFFEEEGTIKFSSITLRNGGQDISGSRLRDSFFQTLAQDMNVDSIRTRLAVVYVNGEYWGLYNLNEEQEAGYFESYYGLDGDSIDLINRNNTVVKGTVDNFLAVRDYGQNWDLADNEVFAEYTQLVDADACIDYIIVNTFFGNGDVLNQRFWHAQDNSVLWRPILFDLDWCMRFNQKYRNTFNRYFKKEGSYAGNGTLTLMDIFYGLKQNASWKEKFAERFVEVAYNDFDTDKVLAVFDDFVTQMEPEMERHIERWGTHKDMDSWREQTSSFRIALEMRRDIVLPQMAKYFGVSDERLNELISKYSN